MRKTVLFLLSVLFLMSAYGQQGNKWYFGNKAALDFNQGSPVSISNSGMVANEGSASISDENGILLFYSNGLQVFNRNHQVMLNGDQLSGNRSALQACVIVAVPGNDSIYYLFTADAYENNFAAGYTYSIINLRRDNGLGAVISKNNLLIASGTERLTAVRHGNGSDTWIITNDRNSNVFRAWLISCSGLNTTSVVSTTGMIMDKSDFMNVGMMKFSPDGKQLCQTNYGELLETADQSNFFQLFDFDNLTGVLSNAQTIAIPGAYYYGCEYSPDSKLVYVLRSTTAIVDQFETKLASSAAIIASRQQIPAQKDLTGIQLAPDGRIYLTRNTSSLSVITAPGVKGPGCGYIKDQLSVSPGNAGLQLPAFMNDINSDPFNTFTYAVTDTCSGTVVFSATSSLPGSLVWHWDFGDGTTADAQDVVHVFTDPRQLYKVTLSISNAQTCSRTFRISKQVLPRGIQTRPAFNIIEKCDSGYTRFVNQSPDADNRAGSFTWDFGDGSFSTETHPVHQYLVAGNYPVKLKTTSSLACLADSITQPFVFTRFAIVVAPGKTTIAGDPVQLFVTSGERASYRWTPTASLSMANIANPVAVPLADTYYKVIATNAKGCIATDSILVKVISTMDIYVPTAFTPNGDGKNDRLIPFFPLSLQLKNFSVYNRWGQMVFSSAARGDGWDGKLNGSLQAPGAFVWILTATDATGAAIIRKGSLILSR